jgi:hypothetical protein
MSEPSAGPGSVDTSERSPSPARRWWHFYPAPTSADLERLASQHLDGCRFFEHDPALDDHGARQLLLGAHLHPGDSAGSFARERVRYLVANAVQDATIIAEARGR